MQITHKLSETSRFIPTGPWFYSDSCSKKRVWANRRTRLLRCPDFLKVAHNCPVSSTSFCSYTDFWNQQLISSSRGGDWRTNYEGITKWRPLAYFARSLLCVATLMDGYERISSLIVDSNWSIRADAYYPSRLVEHLTSGPPTAT